MAGNTVKLTFAGDSASLDRTFSKVSGGAKDMASDLEDASKKSRSLADSVGNVNHNNGDAEGKFTGAADTLDGLSTLMGFNISAQIGMARGFADLAGGLNATVGPALQSMIGKIGILKNTTFAQTVAQNGLNAAMRANPVLLVVTAIAALAAGFVVAYKKSETFRAIVNGAFAAVRSAVDATWSTTKKFFSAIGDAVTGSAKTLGKVADIITTPYQIAFRAIASLWNNTVGRLSFKVPGWVPGIGGNGFDVPNIPMLAKGGIARAGQPHIVGERGPELFVPGMTGRVVPNNQLGGASHIVLELVGGSDPILDAFRKSIRVRGGNVQVVLGA